MASERLQGERISPSQRLAYCAALRKLWAADPSLTQEQAQKQTGAPRSVVLAMRARLVAEGRLQAHQYGRRNLVPKSSEPQPLQGERGGEAASGPSLGGGT